MQRASNTFGFWLLAGLSVAVALYSYRFAAAPWGIFPAVDEVIQDVFRRMPLAMTAHALFGATALLVGPFQFVAGLRQRRPLLHRWLGRVYAAACIIAGVGALASAPHASGGPVAGAGFALLGVSWIAATGGAWVAALNRNFMLHRRLMLYSFAMTFAAVTLRLQIPFGIAVLDFKDYASLSPWLAYTAWLPNVAAVWLWTRRPVGAANPQ